VQTIIVPGPPKSAFNKNRRVSDLILHQLRHFQHVAQKSGMKIDPALERDIATEGGAARYIATVTRQIRAQATGPKRVTVSPAPIAAVPAPATKPAPTALDLAAAAGSVKATPGARKRGSGKAKKSSGKAGRGRGKS